MRDAVTHTLLPVTLPAGTSLAPDETGVTLHSHVKVGGAVVMRQISLVLHSVRVLLSQK